MIPFGVNIRLLRRARKLSQDEMMELLGVSRSTWSNYETGYTEPDFAIILKISEFFRISIDVLLKVNLYVEQEKGKGIDFFVGKNIDEIGKLIGKEIGNVNDKNGAKEASKKSDDVCKECQQKDKIIKNQETLIEVLNGQIDALKMATVHMSARLEAKDTPKKESDQS